MIGLRKGAVLAAAALGLAACGPGGGFRNVLDGNEYRVLTAWPMLCHADGSIIMVQKTNPAGGFTDATETAQPCAKITDKKFKAVVPAADPPDAPEPPDGFFGGGDFFGGALF